MIENLFRLYKGFNSKGRIEIAKKYVKSADYRDLLVISRYFAEKGSIVKIPTPVHYKDERYHAVFGMLIGTIYERKCPDLIIDGICYEYERYTPPFKKRKIANMISHGAKQSPRIIINNNKGCSDRFIRRNILERIADKSFKYEIKEVWIYEKGKVRLFFVKNRGE
jgi:hypothetical protein